MQSPLWGTAGAGGASNAPNFMEAIRKTDKRAEDVKLEDLLEPNEVEDIKAFGKNYSAAKKAKKTAFQATVRLPLSKPGPPNASHHP